MPKISGKLKSNPNKTNNLIYIMIYLQGGGVKKIFFALRGIYFFTPPPILNPETALERLTILHFLLNSGFGKIYSRVTNSFSGIRFITRYSVFSIIYI